MVIRNDGNEEEYIEEKRKIIHIFMQKHNLIESEKETNIIDDGTYHLTYNISHHDKQRPLYVKKYDKETNTIEIVFPIDNLYLQTRRNPMSKIVHLIEEELEQIK